MMMIFLMMIIFLISEFIDIWPQMQNLTNFEPFFVVVKCKYGFSKRLFLLVV